MHEPILRGRSRFTPKPFFTLFLTLWLLGLGSLGAAAQPGTLGARLGLGEAPGLTLSLQTSDAQGARYRVNKPERVPAVLKAVTTHLVTQGWLEHPNVSEAPTPKPGTVQQLQSFVQGSDLLECVAMRTGQGAVTLDFTLVSLGAPPQVAAAP